MRFRNILVEPGLVPYFGENYASDYLSSRELPDGPHDAGLLVFELVSVALDPSDIGLDGFRFVRHLFS